MPNTTETTADVDVGRLAANAPPRTAALNVARGHVMRDDIQLLRGVAVLAVLLYHADAHWLAGGYLGVDVFFVVSGFLITRNICQEIERGTFSYASFIARRFRRLLPACYAMLTLSALLAAVFLTRADLATFIEQLIGTLTFSANVVLWQESGYFDASSARKLLLHTWSLSLEEQYYLFLPPILYLGARSGVLRGLGTLRWLGALFAVSLIACFALVPYKPSAVFFLLPFRAWELLAGSLCAVLTLRGSSPSVPHVIKWAAVAVLLTTLAFPPTHVHPGPAALLVVLATAVLMLGVLDFGHSRPARGMYWLGDISYSLYLVHWPLFAVANHVYAGALPLAAKGALLLLALALSYLSFRFVEQPFRAPGPVGRRKVFSLAASAGVLVLLLAMTLQESRLTGASPQADGNAPNYGLSAACAAGAEFVGQAACKSSAAPTVLLWGDSYAMHLAEALVQQQPLPPAAHFGFVQATKSLCGPVPGVAPVTGNYREAWARDCLAFNDSVERYLAEHPEIRLVILGSKWRQYFNDEGQEAFLVRRENDAPGTLASTLQPAAVAASVGALIERLRASGRQVLVVEPPPPGNFDVYQCLQRRREGLPYVGPSPDCQVDRALAAVSDAGLTRLLQALGPQIGLSTFSFAPLLCLQERCRTEIDGVPLYRDEGHFSPAGSRLVGQQSGLNSRISALLGAADASEENLPPASVSGTASRPATLTAEPGGPT